MPDQNLAVLPWPYVEGLRLDEAMHPLTILAVGLYGRELPAQNGAPLRLVVPWKYGFKGIKSIVKISLVATTAADHLEPSAPQRVRLLFQRESRRRPPSVEPGDRAADRRIRPPADAPIQRIRLAGGPSVRRHGFAGQLLMAVRLSKDDVEFSKRLVLVNAFVPLALLCWDLWSGRAGANPLEYATHVTGMLALVFVVLSLTVTPLRRVTKLQWLAQHRRAIGVVAYCYAVLHLLCYWWFDKRLDVGAVFDDVLKRRFILVGMLTVLLMTPLAITSTNGMIKRLGGKRWRLLHRLNYAIGVGAGLHYFMLVKADVRLPLAFIGVVALLLGFRLADSYIIPNVGRHQPEQPSSK